MAYDLLDGHKTFGEFLKAANEKDAKLSLQQFLQKEIEWYLRQSSDAKYPESLAYGISKEVVKALKKRKALRKQYGR